MAVATLLTGVFAAVILYVYFFGIAPETKRRLEDEAVQRLGETAVSQIAQNQIKRIPTTDQEDIKRLRQNVNDAVDRVASTPVGGQAVRAATQVWDSAQNYSKTALQRVSTFGEQTKEQAKEQAGRVEDETANKIGKAGDKASNKIGQAESELKKEQ